MTVAAAAICHCYINRDFQLYKKKIWKSRHIIIIRVELSKSIEKCSKQRVFGYAMHYTY